MRTILIGLMALGGIAAATPAVAQGVYLDTPGVGVEIGRRDRDYDRPRYRDYDRPRYREYRGYDRSYGYRSEGCRTITIRRDDGSVRRIRRCG
jgi:hypothetical protein